MTLHVDHDPSENAREALDAALHTTVEVTALLNSDHHPAEESRDAVNELARAGLATVDRGLVTLSIALAPRPQIPSDTLEEVVTAIDTLLALRRHTTPIEFPAALRERGLDDSLAGAHLATTVTSLLQLAMHHQAGRIDDAGLVAQFPHASQALARAIHQGPARFATANGGR